MVNTTWGHFNMKTSVLPIGFVFIAAVLSVEHSSAQATLFEENSSISEPSEPKRKSNLEEITVTGSRIKRTEFSSSSPIEIITSEKSTLAGLLTASDVLQGSSFASGQQIDSSFSAFVIDGGPGSEQISLRGLGAQRTLVLVNGKRWVPSGVGGAVNAVDLTALPDFLVERYEILKDGASSIYGADAVSGVVNMITNDTQDGLTVSIALDRPQNISQGDFKLDALWGATGGNWTLNIAAGFSSNNAIKQSALPYARCETRPRLTDQDDDGVIDNTHPVTGDPLCFGMIYGFAVSPFGWARYDPSLANPSEDNPNYDPTINGEAGIPFFTTVPTSNLDNAGTFYQDDSQADVNDAVPNRDIYSLTSLGSYDLSLADRTATAYYEFFHNHRKNTVNSGYRQIFPTVPADNPFNPFGIHGPLGEDGSSAIPLVPSYHIENPVSEVDISRNQLFTGLKGTLTGTWTYDMYLGYGNSEGHYRRQLVLDDRLRAALNVSENVDNQIACNDLENYPGCVPIDMFSEEALLEGRLPQNAVDFLVKDTGGKTVYETTTFSAYATGDLFDLPGGPTAGVIGVEYRRESIHDQPDIESINNNFYGFSAAGVSKGADEISEAFAELELPLLSNLPLFEKLDAKLAGRYTDYKSFGADETFQIGLDWSVTKWFRLRGTFGTSFRAPDLYEQFLGDQTGFIDGFIDPCKSYRETSDPGDVIFENCESLGLPEEYFEGAPGILTVTGGSSTLRAETSESSTYGFVFNPDEIDFSLGVTWWDITLENTLVSLAASQIVGACYSSNSFTSPFCQRIGERDEYGDISSIDASFINVGEQATRGYDIDFLYEKSFPSFDFAMDLTATYLDEFSEDILEEQYDHEGRYAYPFWNADLDFRFDWKEWTFSWKIDWIGDTREDNVYDPGTRNRDRITWTGDEYYHSFGTKYDIGDVQVLATVRNVFDEEPPLVADGSGSLTGARVFNTLPGAGYPLFGREFVLRFVFEIN